MSTLLGAQNLSDLYLARIRSDFKRTDNSILRNSQFFIYQSTALVASALAYQGSFNLNLATGFNNNAAIRYVQFFDQVALPALGNVPLQSIPVNPIQEFSWSPSEDGLVFSVACVFGISTTAATFTAGAADLFMRIEGIAI